ncbi:excinuclease ABC subunit UvrC [Campylobacter corcagiensis]|uniref:UvrABC system protein C n=1 Tax=Campylobacter corcagiensis TaxID=1448857 RepID=A0A7M1LFW6_9BACT|nr:excinuclease ABC subunit UvrC [Campylobacter corcagiensis]QKF64364.1 UvrABC nucleotide excision repair complex, subunit UvrC [Campylobacter corcagiensis]QOQ87448.1 excinuclease ABC subunit UvrC [Campylobacter corcagiensis]
MLENEVKTLPNLPGVYQYFDSSGKLLYVGKAKNLKNRIKSYFSFTPEFGSSPRVSSRISKMLNEAVHLEYIVTKSESDALILENSFIKQLNPKYNILLRDDKTYPYIYINLNDEFPRFELTRKVIKGSNIKYFGPYFRGGREILEILYTEFPLVQRKNCIKDKKACLYYQISRCLAPCENKISSDDYKQIVNNAIKALKNPTTLVPNLEKKMFALANSENFEQAAKVRDNITLLKEIDVKVEVDLARLEDFEVIAINVLKGFICAVRFSVRDGKISNSNFRITNSKTNDFSEINEIYRQVILDAFPLNSPVASSKIYTYHAIDDSDVLTEILTNRHDKKFEIITPKIGEKRKICEIAMKNAEINILKHIKTHDFSLLAEIKEYFNLSNLPVNIEAFDNSHMMGEAIVGAMIAYNESGFLKQNYRHAYLKSKNDYDQMSEFLTLRAKRFTKLSPPDLWVIDGGKALLDLAISIIESSGANSDVIAISKEKVDAKAYRAKGSAKDKIYTKNGVFNLNPDDKKLQFFQKLRDEAHRFAISFHRKSKTKADLEKSKLLKLGLSEGKIKKLLNFYGTFDKIHSAEPEEIRNLIGKTATNKLFNNKF